MVEAYSERPTAGPRRLPGRLLIGIGAGAFLLGSLATWLVAGSPTPSLPGLMTLGDSEPTTAIASPVPTQGSEEESAAEAQQAVARVEQMAEQQGGIDQRVAAMEQRLTRLDLQAQAAAGNAARAEGLLVIFATRRSIERGAPLGYLADQLRLRFADAQPRTVQTVIDASRDPVTLDQLLARLDGLSPRLDQSPVREGALSFLSRELGELFVVRREDSPSPAPNRRIERARLFLESGRAGAAAAEVRNLPNATEAADWIADAERYAATQRALELLETTAILEPRRLRDGSGNLIEQPSPGNE